MNRFVIDSIRGQLYDQEENIFMIDQQRLTNLDEHLASHLDENPRQFLSRLKDILSQSSGPIKGASIRIRSSKDPVLLESITLGQVGRMITVGAIVVKCFEPRPIISHCNCRCTICENTIIVNVEENPIIPKKCQNPSGLCNGKYQPMPTQSTFCDSQVIQIQELPENSPFGQVPRRVSAIMRSYLVDEVVPGDRVTITGIYSSNPRQQHVFIDVLEIKKQLPMQSEDEDQVNFAVSAQSPDHIQKLIDSIAPAIFGHRLLKFALLCQLFGGTSKILPDSIKLRGAIHILMLGEPGCGKSQFLKFVNRVSPISVYSSGQGSSTAGLTAVVSKSQGTGEFYLEAGALILADGGIVCIDEFDKLSHKDRVALHEAMEQQTISIAKAGITSVLNSRASVLAAGNPPSSAAGEMPHSLLSRFDLVFYIWDKPNRDLDQQLAKFILNVHLALGSSTQTVSMQGKFTSSLLKKFLINAKKTVNPKLSSESAKILQNHFLDMRKHQKYSRPIGWRQLEGLVRISSAIARMCMSSFITPQHCDLAIELMTQSLRTVDSQFNTSKFRVNRFVG